MKQHLKKNMMTLFSAALMNMVLPLFSVDIYVDINNQTGSNLGTPQAPFTTIQAGIAAATSGDMIHVAQGNYVGNISIVDLTLTLQGGYAGNSSSNYATGASGNFSVQDPNTFITIIRGDGKDAAVSLINSGTSQISGFTVKEGAGSQEGLPYSLNGGGFYISGGSPVINGNIIEENNSYQTDHPDINDVRGGGVFATDADVTIRNNIIRNNRSGRGGGITVFYGSNVLIEDNTISSNHALDDHGGGLYLAVGNFVVRRNTIQSNQVGYDLGWGWGGGYALIGEGSIGWFSENIITDNLAHSSGSGVFIDDGASATMQHELVFLNRSTECNGQVYVDAIEDSPGHFLASYLTLDQCTIADGCGNGIRVEYSSVEVHNSIVWNHPREPFSLGPDAQISVNYCLSSSIASGTGNLESDPLFAGNADYHLRSTGGRWTPAGWVMDSQHSPAIDAGDPVSGFALEAAPHGGRVNLGVYGNTAQASRSRDGELPAPTVSDRVIPHLTRAGGGFKTRVYLENQTHMPQNYRLQPFDADGNALGEVSGTVPAQSISGMDATQLLPDDATHFFIGQQDEVNAYVAYESISQPSSPAHAVESLTQSRRWRFYPGNWDLVFDGIAVINRGAGTADIQVRHYDLDGQLLQSETVIQGLAILGKGLYVVGAPEGSTFELVSSSYFVIESSQPINLIALRGTPPNADTHYLWINPAIPLED